MHPSQRNEIATVADWISHLSDEPEALLAASRGLFAEEAAARQRLAALLPVLVAELAPHEEGALGRFVARAVPGMNWPALADELAGRFRWAESRRTMRKLAVGMRTKPDK